jgi:hypothetical protein
MAAVRELLRCVLAITPVGARGPVRQQMLSTSIILKPLDARGLDFTPMRSNWRQTVRQWRVASSRVRSNSAGRAIVSASVNPTPTGEKSVDSDDGAVWNDLDQEIMSIDDFDRALA